jgi:hypothetical protein
VPSRTRWASRVPISPRRSRRAVQRTRVPYTKHDDALLSEVRRRRLCPGQLRLSPRDRAGDAASAKSRGGSGNRKRVYRVMRDEGLLARYTGRVSRAHDGKSVTLKSNLRWRSAAVEIPCRSGERVAGRLCPRWLMVESVKQRASTRWRRRRPSNGSPTTDRPIRPRRRANLGAPWAARLHDARVLPRVQRHGRVLRQEFQTRLRLPKPPRRRPDCHAAAARRMGR